VFQSPSRAMALGLPLGLILPVTALVLSLLVGPHLATASTTASMSLSPISGPAGALVVAAGRGFPASVSGNKLMFGKTQVATFRTDASGAFSVTFAVPLTAPGGGHVVSTTVRKVTASATFQVVAASPSPSPTPTPSPSASPTPTPSPTPSPSPAPTSTATPTPTPTPTSAPTASPSPEPPSPDGSLLVTGAQLAALPTSGEAWDRMLADATGVWGAPDASDQIGVHARLVLAGALVAARTGDTAMRGKVISAIEGWWRDGAWSTNLLALARQAHGYVMAADLVGYRAPGFVEWLRDARTREAGSHGRWRTLWFTAGNTANNWGTWSLASLIAIDAYVADPDSLARDWAIYRGYGQPFATGWAGSPLVRTMDWSARWSCVASDGTNRTPIAINTPCLADGVDLDGAIVEDVSRSASYPVPDGNGAMYAWESVRAITLQAILLDRAGFDAWGVNESQVARMVGYLRRTASVEVSIDGTLWGYDRHPHNAWARLALNRFLGTSYPVNHRSDGDRAMGYADWLWP
jgi:hypothetical protein